MTGPLRRRTLIVMAALVVSVLGLAACNSGPVTTLSSPPTTDNSLTLSTLSSPAGPILATGSGQALYDFVPDTPTRSACLNDGCVFQWPPLLKTAAVTVGRGLDATLVGTLQRPDGSTQLSYGGHPLYTYNLDVKAGMVTGQAIDQDGGLWYVLSPAGKEIHSPFSITG